MQVLNKIHKTSSSAWALTEEARKLLADMVELEQDLGALIQLRIEDPKRHIQASAQFFGPELSGTRHVDVDIPIQSLIDAKLRELDANRIALSLVYTALIEAGDRIQWAARDEAFGRQRLHRDICSVAGPPMVGPGRDEAGGSHAPVA